MKEKEGGEEGKGKEKVYLFQVWPTEIIQKLTRMALGQTMRSTPISLQPPMAILQNWFPAAGSLQLSGQPGDILGLL